MREPIGPSWMLRPRDERPGIVVGPTGEQVDSRFRITYGGLDLTVSPGDWYWQQVEPSSETIAMVQLARAHGHSAEPYDQQTAVIDHLRERGRELFGPLSVGVVMNDSESATFSLRFTEENGTPCTREIEPAQVVARVQYLFDELILRPAEITFDYDFSEV